MCCPTGQGPTTASTALVLCAVLEPGKDACFSVRVAQGRAAPRILGCLLVFSFFSCQPAREGRPGEFLGAARSRKEHGSSKQESEQHTPCAVAACSPPRVMSTSGPRSVVGPFLAPSLKASPPSSSSLRRSSHQGVWRGRRCRCRCRRPLSIRARAAASAWSCGHVVLCSTHLGQARRRVESGKERSSVVVVVVVM